ncbi:hypothetical protein PV327_007720 [Microctonus hyperodae]|uniref:Uncharacterized protein n=1 Tax=Microctonus hyperodae TaxID=165561 RepID=A0AA39FZT1_MICHY|nr:hypothetical protein PV327_007720 [Microctonus hyperodae]
MKKCSRFVWNSQLGYVHSLPKLQNLTSNKLQMGMVNGNNKDYSERPMIENKEDLYFHPDTVLFHPKDRKTDSFETDTNNNTYMSFNKSTATKKYPIKPIKLNPVKLPEPDDHAKIVPHVLSKTLWPVDFKINLT